MGARRTPSCFVVGALVLSALPFVGAAHAQTCAAQLLSAAMLGFENEAPQGVPGGWSGFPPGTVFADAGEKHGGLRSLRFARDAKSAGEFSSVARVIPIDFVGKHIVLSGWLRTEGSGTPRLWMRQDGEKPNLAFVTLPEKWKAGSEWARFSMTFERHRDAKTLIFGVSFSGEGRGWADDLELLVDGKPFPGTEPGSGESAVMRDHEFDLGSRFALATLSDAQVDALVLTGKVWGFLKYHHPAVTAGQHHWDFDLLRRLPALTTARQSRDVQRLLIDWIDSLGPVPDRAPQSQTAELQLRPDLRWLDDRKLLGKELSARLKAVYRNRVPGQQNFVCLAPNVGNPLLGDEPLYPQVTFPDSGFQILTIYRFWNVIEYWFPYRALIDENRDEVLRDSLRKASSSMDAVTFQREMLAHVARTRDGHANLWSAFPVREPVGACQLPLSLRHLEGKFVIKALIANASTSPFKPGDVVVSLDGVPLDDIAGKARPFYGASNEAGRTNQIASGITRGACGPARVQVLRDNLTALDAERVSLTPMQLAAGSRNDRTGETFQMLSPEVAYLKLSSIKAEDVTAYIEKARTAKALIVDIRNYPSAYVVYALGNLLVDSRTPFVTFTHADLSNPGAFHWSTTSYLEPQEPHFAGRVAILVDESSISQAEYTAMALRASPRAIVVGMQTAGADGNISVIPLPGNLRTGMSGIGVFYPDRTPTQQVGVKLDVTCPNTIAGLRDGRDETLECALRELAGTR